MYVTLELAKQHLNIEQSYTGDDTYITHLIEVAETTVEKHIDYHLEDYIDEEQTELPKPLQHAILLFVGDMYMSRESNAYGISVSEIPFSYDYLLSLYKDYSGLYSTSTEEQMIDEICRHTYIDQTTGDVVIDPTYKKNCLMCGGARSRAYRRLFKLILESAHIDNNGDLIIG